VPTIRLDEKTIADLQGPDNCIQAYYWDTDLTGLGVVVDWSTKTFVARAGVNGKNRRVKIGVAGQPRPDGHLWSVALARAEAKQISARCPEASTSTRSCAPSAPPLPFPLRSHAS
jgi:hypothetical protein